MFQTSPVKMSRMAPSSMPICRLGNSDIMASMTPGRKLSTGIDCRMSSVAIISASSQRL